MNSKEKDMLRRINMVNVKRIIEEEKEDKILKNLHQLATFQPDVFEKGEEWYKSGLSLDEVPEEFKTNRSFINGYKRGQRLAMIEEMQSKRIR